jgi:hypothetical protein
LKREKLKLKVITEQNNSVEKYNTVANAECLPGA